MSQKDDAYFWEGAREGKLLLRACEACGSIAHPPVPMCPKCHSLEWTTRSATGRGKVYVWMVSKHPTMPDENPRLVALIDLEEGVRMVSNLVDCDLAEISLGAHVRLTFGEVDGNVLPQFELVR